MRPTVLAAIGVFVVAALNFLVTLPNALDFTRFAFGDPGWALSVDALLDDGACPTRDFAYFYGLLTLLIDRTWFAAVGRTPESLVALFAVGSLATALGVYRILSAAGAGALAWGVAICALPLTTLPGATSSPAHAIEAALLVNALAFHLRGRLGWALALTTLAVLVKPSLGYVYGLILLIQVVSGWPERAPRRFLQLIPSAVILVVAFGTLGAMFGADAVVRTQFPTDAGKVYAEENFGFFRGVGRKFWQPEQPSPGYYLRTPIGPWLLASGLLLVGAVRAVPRLRDPAHAFVLTCAALHLVFVCLVFGNQWSWIYYPYLPFVGAAVAVDRFRGAEHQPSCGVPLGRFAGWVLAVWLLIVVVLWIGIGSAAIWLRNQRSPDTAGLYSAPQTQKSWASVRQIANKEPVFVLNRMGCAPLLVPGLEGPRSWCLLRSIATPAEMDWVRERLGTVNWVLVPKWHDNNLVAWPEFEELMRAFRPAMQSETFTLYQRVAGPRTG